jgi:hypothetical protein
MNDALAGPADCAFLITIGTTGTASVTTVPGATAFNTMQTLADNTTDPGNDGSLVGVINDDSKPLSSLTLKGMGANYGIFDFTRTEFASIQMRPTAPPPSPAMKVPPRASPT